MMATRLMAVALACLLLCGLSSCSGASMGLSYNANSHTLSSPLKLLEVLKERYISKVRLLDANHAVLEALSGTGIEVSVGISNQEIKGIGHSKSQAAAWVKRNILKFVPNTLITSIIVGNGAASSDVADSLVPAMEAIHSVLVASKLERNMKVSTALSFSLVQMPSDASKASFKKDFDWVLQPVLTFISRTRSFLVLNIEPHDRCRGDFVQSVAEPALNAMAALQHFDIPLVISDICLSSEQPLEHAGETLVMDSRLSAVYLSSSSLEHVSASYSGFRELLGKNISSSESRNESNSASQAASFFLGNDASPTTITPSVGATWCVAKNNADDTTLQVALDYACGLGGADCSAIQQGGVCFDPDNVQAHASYAFNSYYIKNGMLPGSCDFSGSAAPTTLNPSHGNCVYETSSGSSIVNGTIPSGGTMNGAGGIVPGPINSNAASAFLCPTSLIFSSAYLLLIAIFSKWV